MYEKKERKKKEKKRKKKKNQNDIHELKKVSTLETQEEVMIGLPRHSTASKGRAHRWVSSK